MTTQKESRTFYLFYKNEEGGQLLCPSKYLNEDRFAYKQPTIKYVERGKREKGERIVTREERRKLEIKKTR